MNDMQYRYSMLFQHYHEVEAQRDELLEALENLVDLCEAGDGSEEHQRYEPQEMKAARAAISKAKGEQ